MASPSSNPRNNSSRSNALSATEQAPPSISKRPGPSNSPATEPKTSAAQTPALAADASPAKNPKSMTKAERRELQEKQRAAKKERDATGEPKGKGKAASSNAPSLPAALGSPSTSRTTAPSSLPSQPPAATRDVGRSIVSAAGQQEPGDAPRGSRIFSHFGLPKAPAGSNRAQHAIHPAIIRLGLQFSQFRIVGANARCIATLIALRTVIQDYSTPPNITLSRHLERHLNPQINHLVAARPMAVTMGTAIRQLKKEITESNIDLPEQDAKNLLCQNIDDYIRDRIIVADQVITDTAEQKINDGDVILTYGRSSVVQKVLLGAHQAGKRISVVVVDARPLLEGKHLLRVLTDAGIHCTYLLLPSLGSFVAASKSGIISSVFLGAHSIHADGAVYSRAGTALVAMVARKHGLPVLVCCETYKFAESVVLDGFTKNELVPADQHNVFPPYPSVIPRESLAVGSPPNGNLQLLSPLYDLTPASDVTAVVTEVGIIPPNSISSIPLTLGR